MSDERDERCRSCGAAIVWAYTASGRRMPVDAEPVDDGTLKLSPRVGQLHVFVVGPHPSEPRYRAHFVTCPDADGWRRR